MLRNARVTRAIRWQRDKHQKRYLSDCAVKNWVRKVRKKTCQPFLYDAGGLMRGVRPPASHIVNVCKC